MGSACLPTVPVVAMGALFGSAEVEHMHASIYAPYVRALQTLAFRLLLMHICMSVALVFSSSRLEVTTPAASQKVIGATDVEMAARQIVSHVNKLQALLGGSNLPVR